VTPRPTILDDALAVAAHVARLVEAAARARPPAGILLAGGTTPRRAYESIDADCAGVHVWYGDERMVAPAHPDSNHGMVARAWLDRAGARAPIAHRIPGELGGAEAARRADAELRAHAGDDAALDLAILGVGADGHTASLFPGDPALAAGGLYAAARGGTRVTATLPLLARARRVVFVVTGDGKAAVCAQLLGATPPRELPAALVAAAAADVAWILDRAAAALLP
jgi:6-phosphogluconolactonase